MRGYLHMFPVPTTQPIMESSTPIEEENVPYGESTRNERGYQNVVFTDMHHCTTSDTVYAVQRMGDATCTHLFMRFFLSEERWEDGHSRTPRGTAAHCFRPTLRDLAKLARWHQRSSFLLRHFLRGCCSNGPRVSNTCRGWWLLAFLLVPFGHSQIRTQPLPRNKTIYIIILYTIGPHAKHVTGK